MFKFGFILVLIAIMSCSTERPQGKTEAEILYREAQELIKDGRYLIATEKLNTIKSQHPYSYYATHAELLLSDILFEQESYAEAAASYILFKDFHPKNDKIPYVLFKIAESYYHQLPSTFDRDLTSAHEAIKYYNELLQRYPKSEYVKNADERIRECFAMIRDKEQYIADFYFKTEVYDAALFRYQNIIKDFSYPPLIQHSMTRAIESSYLGKRYKDCVDNYKKYFHLIKDKDTREKVEKYYQTCTEKLKGV